MTASPYAALILGLLLAAPAALAHEAAASGGSAGMLLLLLLLGATTAALGLQRLRSSARTRLFRHFRDGV